MSQMDLDKGTGLDRTLISDLTYRVQGPSHRMIFRVAKGVGADPCSLIEDAMNSHFLYSQTQQVRPLNRNNSSNSS
jgi:hypothetical protein